MSWTGLMTNYSFSCLKFLSSLLRADLRPKDIMKVREQILDGPSQNFMYARQDGEIGYLASGRYPNVTRASTDILDGTSSQWDWHGLLPVSTNLHLKNPAKDYIVTANSKAVSNNFKGGPSFEQSLFTSRMFRINQLLQEQISRQHKFTAEDMLRIQEDTVDVMCLRILEHTGAVLDQLRGFDCNYTSMSVLATRQELLLGHFEVLLAEALNISSSLLSQNFVYLNAGKMLLAKERLQKAVREDSRKDLPFGQFRPRRMRHTFSGNKLLDYFLGLTKELPGSGSIETVNVAKTEHFLDEESFWQANLKEVLSFVGRDYWSSDGGQSGHFLSSHYFDLRMQFPGEMLWGSEHFEGLEGSLRLAE